MASQVVFGSPEARAILERDKELERQKEKERKEREEEERENSPERLAERLRNIERDISIHEDELGWLNHERDELRAMLADAGGRLGRK